MEKSAKLNKLHVRLSECSYHKGICILAIFLPPSARHTLTCELFAMRRGGADSSKKRIFSCSVVRWTEAMRRPETIAGG